MSNADDTLPPAGATLERAFEALVDRAVEAQIFSQRVRVSSPEGLIVMKLIAMRPQDEADIQDLLASSAARIDLDFIRKELDSVSEADDPRRAKFESWVRRAISGA